MRLGHKSSTLRFAFPSLPPTCLIVPDAHNVSTFPLKDKQQLLSTETPKIQGEWIGYSATYEIDSGKVVHVPEKWVPDAFIDWGVIVNGLEHMTSAVLDGDLLRIKETLILPKVGCEEDSVAVDISEYQIPYKSVAFVPFPGGSFSYGPTSLQGDGSRLDILTHMAFSHSTESERWTRLGVTVSFETKRIHLVKEEWNSEYNGGQSLIGCGGNIEAFDDDQRLDPSDLLQFQKGNKITWSKDLGMEMQQDTDCAVPWTVDRILFDWYLPANAHVRCFYGEDDRFCLQTGWLATPSQYFLVSREYNHQQEFIQATWFESKVDI
ncbi:uncharacterized protein Gasu_06120 [Galdieria sulphuraria]|uniref:DUF3598 domain-containing protein n=1 Tax=Galdieria sulphuraria TaxID=130081 RepID=M2X6Q7_GALSU|nr:uncharacterized protein Gasu_06120 [Galdieria sulphuraria]EME32200.1 hypothetical protein Gasu_06120 [Galdieria sulphuraria]|eukprot:XP_005708720.1 hypothetical protein Gasu_06120 [Galdieria sulphuraria]